jgi:site-specific DNA recombinase
LARLGRYSDDTNASSLRTTDYLIRMTRNIQRGVREKLRRGEWPAGTKAVGYMYDNRLRNIVPDPKKAKIVETIFKDYASGEYGLEALAQRLFDMGVKSRSGRPRSKCAVYKFLTNRLYIGIMEWGGEAYEGKFKPIISPELFDAVQKALKVKSKPRKTRKGHRFPFCGIFRCSCGSMISAQWGRGNGGLYRYYRCSRKSGMCGEPYIREELLKEQCLKTLRPLAISAEEARSIRALVEEEASNEANSSQEQIEAVEKRLEPLQSKLNRLTHGYLDEVIDEDTYREAKAELLLEKVTLKREKERLRKGGSSTWFEPTEAVINALESMGNEKFPDSLPEMSKQVRKIGTNHQISGKKVTFTLAEPYDFIPSLLASARIATLNSSASRSEEIPQRQIWCSREDLNLHGLPHTVLSRTRLPVPPRERVGEER